MRILTLSAGSRRGVTVLNLREADGTPIDRKTFTFESAKGETAIAEAVAWTGISKPDLLKLCDKLQTLRPGEEVKAELPDAVKPAAPAGQFIVRGREQVADQGATFPTFAEALACADYPAPEPLIDSKASKTANCMLDVDYHGDYRPPAETLDLLLDTVEPRPSYAWITHGKGLRFIYQGAENAPADELCAVAAVSVLARSPLARVEFKTVTRHPRYANARGSRCGSVIEYRQTTDTEAVKRLLGAATVEIEDSEIADWLAAKGLEIGKRYPHSHCPIAPYEKGERTPVVIRDAGIYCHRCASVGASLGKGKPGWVSWEKLLGHWIPALFRQCVANWCHFGHAKHILADTLRLEGPIAESVYRASLKMLHGADDPRVPRAFLVAKTFVRLRDHYVTYPSGAPYVKSLEKKLSCLPAANYRDEDGKLKVSEERVADLQQPTDLTCFGYPPLTPEWGGVIYRHNLFYPDESRIPVIFYPEALAKPENVKFRPRYVEANIRSESEAWATLEEVFPQLYRPAVKLLIAAKGCADADISMPPFIFVSGPSGSAKTSTFHVAAAIAGDSCHEVTWSNSTERIRQGIQMAKEQGSFVLFNELLKEGRAGGQSFCESMDFLLNLTPDSLSHHMYVGPVKLGRVPVCGFTDTHLPAEIKQASQIARRMVHVEMPKKVNWENTIKEHIRGKICYLRVSSPRYAEASDVIFSAVIDEFFDRPRAFFEIAESLGFPALDKSREAADAKDDLRAFFVTVFDEKMRIEEGGKAERDHITKNFGRGWVPLKKNGETALTLAWNSLCDNVAGDGWFNSRKCSEVDWRQLLGLPDGPKVEHKVKNKNGWAAIRFEGMDEATERDVVARLKRCIAAATETPPPVNVEPATETRATETPGNVEPATETRATETPGNVEPATETPGNVEPVADFSWAAALPEPSAN